MAPPRHTLLSALLSAQRDVAVLERAWGRRGDPTLRERMDALVCAVHAHLGAQWGDALRWERDHPGYLKEVGWSSLSGACESRILGALCEDYLWRVGGGAPVEQVAQVASLARACAPSSDRLLELSDEALGLLCLTPADRLGSVCAEFHRVWHEFPDMRKCQARYELTLRLIHARIQWQSGASAALLRGAGRPP